MLQLKITAAAKASSRFVFQGDGPEFDESAAASADAGEPAGDEEGEDEDLGLAWEILDLARMIFEKAPSEDNKEQLADVHILLGDISLESGGGRKTMQTQSLWAFSITFNASNPEMFDQAISEFQIAVDMKESYLAPNNRQLAEANWKLGLALEYSKKFPEAIERFKKALAALEAKRESLQSTIGETSEKGKEAASEEATANEAELKEVEDLLPELRTKVRWCDPLDGVAWDYSKRLFLIRLMTLRKCKLKRKTSRTKLRAHWKPPNQHRLTSPMSPAS